MTVKPFDSHMKFLVMRELPRGFLHNTMVK